MPTIRRAIAILAGLAVAGALASCGSSAATPDSSSAAPGATSAGPPSSAATGAATEPTAAGASSAASGGTVASGGSAPASPASSGGSGSAGPTSTAGASTGTSPEPGAYPVTIHSALGSVTLDHQPTRIATWGWSAQDDVLALGLVPVAMPNYSYGGNKDQVLPWDAQALKALGAKTPLLLNSDTDEVPFEQFVTAAPDVILAPYSGLTQQDYDTLSKIAPVVAYPDKPWATTWQDQLTIIGKALGLSAKARTLQDEIDSHIADLSAKYPVLHGKTFVYAAANQPGQLNVYRASDPRVQLLVQLGLKLSPSVAALDSGTDASSYFYSLSYEKLDEINTDLLVAYFGDQAAADSFVKTPVVANMAAVKAGRFAPIVGESYVMASSAPSALSIPWMLDRYVPQLAAAAGK